MFCILGHNCRFQKGNKKQKQRGKNEIPTERERERRERDRREKQLKLLGPKFEDKELFRDTGGALE